LHVTLAFFGNVPDGQVPALVGALGAVPPPPAIQLRLSGAGTFPARGAPRALWVGVDGDVGELATLAREVAAAAETVGVVAANEGRAYRPHLTVGRWPASARADRRLALSVAGYAGPHFSVDGWVLMRSHPQSRYETVARW
jgi:2'-5' RNA ligase